ncbi:MAG: RNB domain-containing ribonuclease [Cyanobacteria bacterium K_Offshore_surface_m2_239]|nr:RNB domain-containing ribonuclease [Cyanobacteria bacterium K_Offshore_surface_m2_239]
MRIGDLVGIASRHLDGKPPLIAVITGLQGARADLRSARGAKVLTLPQRQLDLLASNPDPTSEPAVDPTQAPWQLTPEALASAIPPGRDWGMVWQLLVADLAPGAEPEEHSIAALSELVSGQSDPLHCGACWLWLQGDQTLFRWKQGLAQPRALAELRRLRQDRHRQRLAEAEERAWIQALRQRQPLQEERLPPQQVEAVARLRRWASGDRDLVLADDLRQLLQQARCGSEPAEVRHLLVDLGLWPRHHLPSLQGTSWQQGFSAELLAEAEALVARAEEPVAGDDQRRDLTALPTVTIDDDSTLDIDDGLSLEWLAEEDPRIWIHVADPGRLIPSDSPLDLEARRRGTSLYLARGTLPMFPACLAYGPFSLRAGQRCAAWSVGIRLMADGGLGELVVARSWVRPNYRLSYADADELLELAPPQERDLLTLHALLERRRSWRAAQGALFLDQAEGRVRVPAGDQERPECQLEITEPTASRLLVAEAMILAGAALADYGQRHQLALPYRGQPATPVPTPAELEALPIGPARFAAIKRCLTRGQVSTSPQPHFSLGLAAYVQATSPIRRYGDLLTQRQLAAHLQGEAPLDASALGVVLTTTEAGLREASTVSREDQRHWRQVWFAEQRGQQWRGIFLRWLREDHQLGLVHVESLAMDLAADCHGAARPGDEVLVRVREVDPLRDLLLLDARAL